MNPLTDMQWRLFRAPISSRTIWCNSHRKKPLILQQIDSLLQKRCCNTLFMAEWITIRALAPHYTRSAVVMYPQLNTEMKISSKIHHTITAVCSSSTLLCGTFLSCVPYIAKRHTPLTQKQGVVGEIVVLLKISCLLVRRDVLVVVPTLTDWGWRMAMGTCPL